MKSLRTSVRCSDKSTKSTTRLPFRISRHFAVYDDPMKNMKRKDTGRQISPPARKKLQSSTTSSAVKSFFTPSSEKKVGKTTWAIDQTLIIAHHLPIDGNGSNSQREKRRQIAAFDLDSTLIKATSGKYSTGSTDWMWMDTGVIPKLQSLDKEGYQVVIFSNQGGLGALDRKAEKQSQKRANDFKTKITTLANQLNIPLSLYAATSRDQYRKPRTGMWNEMLDYYDLNVGEGADLAASFFVGDAGGRYKDGKHSDADFSSSDRDFATNIGITFHTPEEFFHGRDVRDFKRIFEPMSYIQNGSDDLQAFVKANEKDLVLFCGSPGAGKSTFYWNQLAPLGYERVNQDTLGTREKCLKKAREYLEEQNKSVVVDNTNAEPTTRKHWIDLARQLKVPVRCMLFTASAPLCEHNDIVRALNGSLMNPESRQMLPRVAFTSFWSRYRKPQLDEGFSDITTVDFKFQGTDDQREIWTKFWI